MKKPEVFYVEDEPSLASIVVDTLSMKGFEVRHFATGSEALGALPGMKADICILDVMLPGLDGFSLGREIKKRWPDMPILYLTAKAETADVLEGFDAGGNDYVRKPFSIAELIARINNLLGRNTGPQQTDLEWVELGRYQFNFSKLTLAWNEELTTLTYREAQLIRHFHAQQNAVVVRKDLLMEIWGDDGYSNSRSLDVYIKKLRDLLKKDSGIEILTLRGLGFRFNVEQK